MDRSGFIKFAFIGHIHAAGENGVNGLVYWADVKLGFFHLLLKEPHLGLVLSHQALEWYTALGFLFFSFHFLSCIEQLAALYPVFDLVVFYPVFCFL